MFSWIKYQYRLWKLKRDLKSGKISIEDVVIALVKFVIAKAVMHEMIEVFNKHNKKKDG